MSVTSHHDRADIGAGTPSLDPVEATTSPHRGTYTPPWVPVGRRCVIPDARFGKVDHMELPSGPAGPRRPAGSENRAGRSRHRTLVMIVAGIAAMLLVAAASGPIEPTSADVMTTRWDDFQRSDGPLADPSRRVLPSGHSWRLGFAPGPRHGGQSQLRISDGRLRFDGPGAAYAWTTGASPASAASVRFVYETGSSARPSSSVGLIISPLTGPRPIGLDGVAANSVHLGFGVDTWAIGIADGSELDVIAKGRYELYDDGETAYRGSVRRTGVDTVDIDTPDGRTHTVSDTRISRYWGPSVLIEHYQPLAGFRTDPRPVITDYRVR